MGCEIIRLVGTDIARECLEKARAEDGEQEAWLRLHRQFMRKYEVAAGGAGTYAGSSVCQANDLVVNWT